MGPSPLSRCSGAGPRPLPQPRRESRKRVIHLSATQPAMVSPHHYHLCFHAAATTTAGADGSEMDNPLQEFLGPAPGLRRRPSQVAGFRRPRPGMGRMGSPSVGCTLCSSGARCEGRARLRAGLGRPPPQEPPRPDTRVARPCRGTQSRGTGLQPPQKRALNHQENPHERADRVGLVVSLSSGKAWRPSGQARTPSRRGGWCASALECSPRARPRARRPRPLHDRTHPVQGLPRRPGAPVGTWRRAAGWMLAAPREIRRRSGSRSIPVRANGGGGRTGTGPPSTARMTARMAKYPQWNSLSPMVTLADSSGMNSKFIP